MASLIKISVLRIPTSIYQRSLFQCHQGQIYLNCHYSNNYKNFFPFNTWTRSYSNCKEQKMSKALVLLAEGAEEMEVVITVDVLRRAQIEVTLAGLNQKELTCSRGVVILPDTDLKTALDKGPYDIVIIPGGLKGVDNLCESCEVGELLTNQAATGKSIAAICAGPKVLAKNDILLKSKITSYPSVKSELEKKYSYIEDNVVIDGNLITSRGPGTAFLFALSIIKHLQNVENARKIAEQVLIDPSLI